MRGERRNTMASGFLPPAKRDDVVRIAIAMCGLVERSNIVSLLVVDLHA